MNKYLVRLIRQYKTDDYQQYDDTLYLEYYFVILNYNVF